MEKRDRIYIAGHTGLIGSAILAKLKKDGYKNSLARTHRQLDLTRQKDVESFFKKEQPLYVFLAAAKVGGINANISYPAQFIYENTMMQTNIIDSAYRYGAKKLLFFGSACCYPRLCPQPIREKYLLSGPPEPTNEAYAIAKISGLTMCQSYNRQHGTNFISAVLTNAYGPSDDFDLKDAHVIPALIRRFHEAKTKGARFVHVWGTGKPRREFIYVEDVADAAVFLMNNYSGSEVVNLGAGYDISIKKLAYLIKYIVGYKGKIILDASRPDGMPRKMLDTSKLKKLGWQAKTLLEEGIAKTYNWYKRNLKRQKRR